MSEIEWLDQDGDAAEGTEPVPSRPRWRHARSGRSVLGTCVQVTWAAAAALALVAPFRTLYDVELGGEPLQRVDGWGRFDAAVTAVEGSGAHAIRFGTVSFAGAALLLVALLLRALSSGSLPSGSLPSGSLPSGSLLSGSLPSGSLLSGSLLWALPRSLRDRLRPAATTASVLAVGVLVALAVVVFLDADAVFDSIRSTVDRSAVGPDRPREHVGPGAWLFAASAALAALGTCLDAFRAAG